ncbi:MAG: hypothetical protein [Arizlama microvirus]|nr:MAG: hypothetical protein [Arizlama microvirus]
MNPALIEGGLQLVGGLFSGKAKKKAAEKLKKTTDSAAWDAINAQYRDIERIAEQTRFDEARLQAASGYDLTKLRDDAEKAGFNPLTVLAATGGAGYDGRGAILTTPFLSSADAYWNKANLQASVGGALVDTAGYLGDAISAAGSAFFGQMNEQNRNALEAQHIAALYQPATAKQKVSSPFIGGTKNGGLAPDTIEIDPSPRENFSGFVFGGVRDWVGNILTGGRPERIDPQTNISGTMTVEAPWLGGRGQVFGSDGDIMGPGEILVAAMQLAPQFFINWGSRAAEGTREILKSKPVINDGWYINPENGMWVHN